MNMNQEISNIDVTKLNLHTIEPTMEWLIIRLTENVIPNVATIVGKRSTLPDSAEKERGKEDNITMFV